MAWAASLVGESEAANSALALATDGGMSDDAGGGVDDLSASAAATSLARAFLSSLSSVDFSATMLDRWCASLLQVREPCLVYLLSAIGAPAVELAVVASLPAAAGDGPAKHTQSPATSINAERPLPLIFIRQSPHLPVPRRNETSPRGHSAAKKGNLRASPGKSGAIASCRSGILRSPAHEIACKK